jgi:formiminoglutamase
MSGESSNAAAWSTRLDRPHPRENLFLRADDPRLGEVVELWRGDLEALRPGRAVLIGFPQEEGVRRNHGRTGTAEAPHEIRQHLYRLTPWDSESGVDLRDHPPLDLGDVRIAGGLEESQQALAEVVAAVLQAGAVPVVLGGGHETAFGHFLGYVAADRPVGIINLDAHLDVRPCVNGLGHSGSPFRQVLEHPTHPLAGSRYVCLGAQPHSVSRDHWRFAQQRGCTVRWCQEVRQSLEACFHEECQRLAASQCQVYVSVDADVVRAADVPGVSAPNPSGLAGEEVLACSRQAGTTSQVSSIDLVEVNPRLDRDGESARWAALALWNFLVGLAARSG